jgi:hypothetical protein
LCDELYRGNTPGLRHGGRQKKTIPHFSISRPIIAGRWGCSSACPQRRGPGSKSTRLIEEGDFHHCQVDDATIGIHTMWDWIADVLDAGG